MPPNDPRQAGITRSRLLPGSTLELTPAQLDQKVRQRSSDKPLSKRKKLCRKTFWLVTGAGSWVQFRCSKTEHPTSEPHQEQGIVDSTTHYSIQWSQREEPLTIRQGKNASVRNNSTAT